MFKAFQSEGSVGIDSLLDSSKELQFLETLRWLQFSLMAYLGPNCLDLGVDFGLQLPDFKDLNLDL